MAGVSLSEIKKSQDAILLTVGENTGISARLEELGMLPGSLITVIQPGNPCLIRVGESRLSIGGADCDVICVVPIDVPVPIEDSFLLNSSSAPA